MEEVHFMSDRRDRLLEGDLPGSGKSVGMRGAGGERGQGKRGGENERAQVLAQVLARVLAEGLGETREWAGEAHEGRYSRCTADPRLFIFDSPGQKGARTSA
ncbi:hypothetical protein [Methylocella sp.]|uniref:hypothetical protein n=1 Tax=Methylocella sp. TaxID=1978226 RepID=UPI003C78BB40